MAKITTTDSVRNATLSEDERLVLIELFGSHSIEKLEVPVQVLPKLIELSTIALKKTMEDNNLNIREHPFETKWVEVTETGKDAGTILSVTFGRHSEISFSLDESIAVLLRDALIFRFGSPSGKKPARSH